MLSFSLHTANQVLSQISCHRNKLYVTLDVGTQRSSELVIALWAKQSEKLAAAYACSQGGGIARLLATARRKAHLTHIILAISGMY